MADLDGTLGLRRGKMAPEMALAIIDFVRAGGNFIFFFYWERLASAKTNFLDVLFEITRDDLIYTHIHVYSSTSERFEYDRTTGEYKDATHTNLRVEMEKLDPAVPRDVPGLIRDLFTHEIVTDNWAGKLMSDPTLELMLCTVGGRLGTREILCCRP